MERTDFVKFYDQYAPRIYRFIRLKVNSNQDAEDLSSESFFKFWDKFGQREVENPPALIYKIANNAIVDFYRQKPRKEILMDPQDSSLERIKADDNLSHNLNINDDMKEIKTALSKIKGDYQNIIIWRYLDDFSIKEIANIMEKPEGAIRVKVHRALKSLKKHL